MDSVLAIAGNRPRQIDQQAGQFYRANLSSKNYPDEKQSVVTPW
jgi:hypothetical protein